MNSADRAAIQHHQEAIARSAQFYGYTLDSSYTYRQVSCPLAPDHLLLAYESVAANGSVSRFTAVVRRDTRDNAAGPPPAAQIIPILHFGITTFVPAIANPHSIEIFNAAISPAPNAVGVLSEVRDGGAPLLLRSLCYLAMVGEEPAALRSPSLNAATIHAPVPTLQFLNHGRTRQLISVRNAADTFQVWALTFAPAGKLLSSTREEHPIGTTAPRLNATNAVPSTAVPATASSAAAVTPIPEPASQSTIAPVMPTSAPTNLVSAALAPVSTPPTPAILRATASVIAAAPQPTQPSPQPIPASQSMPTPQPLHAPSASQPVAPATTAPSLPVAHAAIPQPVGRYIASPPLPPSRFIPNSALQTPPHLPQ